MTMPEPQQEPVQPYMVAEAERKQEAVRMWQLAINVVNPQTIDFMDQVGISSDLDHALDMGCGPGAMIHPLTRMAKFVTAIDKDEVFAEAARINAAAAGAGSDQFIVINKPFLQAELDDESADLVLSRLVFQHILKEEERRKNLVEIGRILKPNATLIIADMDVGAWRVEPKFEAHDILKKALITQREMAEAAPRIGPQLPELVEKAGLQIVKSPRVYETESFGPGKLAHLEIVKTTSSQIIADGVLGDDPKKAAEYMQSLMAKFKAFLEGPSRAWIPPITYVAAVKPAK